jgi:hypothetical protein
MAASFESRHVQRKTPARFFFGFTTMGAASVVCRRTDWRSAICWKMGRETHCALLEMVDGRASVASMFAAANGRKFGAIEM